MDNRAIGVFDSGLGGLTVVKELTRLLPCENIVYFGDTGRVPYGTKGSDTIVKYARQDIRFLLSFDVKAIIIACGTVSSVAFEQSQAVSPVPLVGVVNPASAAAVKATRSGQIGILGTSATIRSGSYGREILRLAPQTKVCSRPCPLFVPLVENGYFRKGSPLATLAAHEYLDEFRGSGIDTLILGCTHYPLLKDVVAEVVGSDVTLIDSGKETAVAAAALLGAQGLLCEGAKDGQCRFYVSDCTDEFAALAGIFLERSVSGYVEKTDIEKF